MIVVAENLIQQARCETCRITFYCLGTDKLKPCSKCGEPLERTRAVISGEEFDCKVEPVKFGTEKAYGIGEVRRRLEKRLILFPRHFNGEPVPNVDRALRLLKAYRVDQNGIPVKKDDHTADSLLCGVTHWAPRKYSKTSVY